MKRLRAAARFWAGLWPALHLLLWIWLLPEALGRWVSPLPGTEADLPLALSALAMSGALGALAVWAAWTPRPAGRLAAAALVPLAMTLALAPRSGWPGPAGEVLALLQVGGMIAALPLAPLVERPEPWVHGLYAAALVVVAAVPPERA